MKLNKITLAIVAAVATPMIANAGVTVSPLLLGYHYADADDTREAQHEALYRVDVNSNTPTLSQDSGLYTGAALGIELTPNSQFQVEYGVSNTDGLYDDDGDEEEMNDVEQETISGNFLIGSQNFTSSNGGLRPYALIGAGQSKLTVEDDSGDEIGETTDTIGNLGLGAFYRVNDALSLRGEARAIHNFDNDWWEGMALGGLEVVLGGHLGAPVVAPEPEPEPVEAPTIVLDTDVDSDGDGVLDKDDLCPGTPANIVVDKDGCPIKESMVQPLKMELRVFFDYDKSAIKPQFKQEISKVAQKMREYPNSAATIEGHASKTARSSAKYNQRLSEARAMAVKSMLTNEFGVAPNRLRTVGYGFTRPIAPNDTAEGRAMNRRVYAVITGNKTVTVEKTKDMQ